MPIPNGFQFNQSNLQDFLDCQRRFQLRHIQHLAWPAPVVEQSDEFKLRINLGKAFHKMVYQHLVGLPTEEISLFINNELLKKWWANYLDSRVILRIAESLDKSIIQIYPEVSLILPINQSRLVAKYDVIARLSGGLFVIIDWKTSEQRPTMAKLSSSLQTRVYSYVLASAGINYFSLPVPADNVKMYYWFANYPDQPELLEYDQAKYKKDDRELSLLIDRIRLNREDNFKLTDDEKFCRFCTYRSLCNRGIKAGDIADLDFNTGIGDDTLPLLSIDTIDEIMP